MKQLSFSEFIHTQVIKAFNYINTICAKYLMRNVLVFLGVIFIVIGLIIVGNQLVLVIKDSLRQGIPIADILPLIGFKMLRNIPLILSLSLFLAIILTVNNLYKNSEAVVMNALGLGDKHFMAFVSPIVIGVFVVVLFLTTIAVPWAKHKSSLITQRHQHTSEFFFIKPREFQAFKNGNIVIYASEVKTDENSNNQVMRDVFIYTLIANEPIITLAKIAQKYTNPKTGSTYLHLKEGQRYHGFPLDTQKKILSFDLYDLQLIDGSVAKSTKIYNNIEGKNIWDLLSLEGLPATVELQWRLSQPLSILILSILGVLLGKTSPRGGKNLNALLGVVVFILYNNALLLAKSALEKGDTSQYLGLWWVHGLMFLAVLVFYGYRYEKFSEYYLRLRVAYLSRVK